MSARNQIVVIPIQISAGEPRLEPGGVLLRVGETIKCDAGRNYSFDPDFDCLVIEIANLQLDGMIEKQ